MARFRTLGYQPVPSIYPSARKQPQVGYRTYWERPAPEEWSDRPCRAVQVMTGPYWGLAVLDLDGPMALELYRAWTMYRGLPPTWESAHTPSKGRHVYFSIRPDRPCPSRFVWDGPERHSGIEILGHRKLVVIPPSRHVGTGRHYRWLPGRSPDDIARPAPMPGWLAEMPDARPKPEPTPHLRHVVMMSPTRRGDRRYFSRDIIRATTDADRRSIAESWGLRLVGDPNAHGWVACHAFDRDDDNPSAGFNVLTGYYNEPNSNKPRLSLFELGAILGGYQTWEHARDDLGCRYLHR